MDQTNPQEPYEYKCMCQKGHIPAELLKAHLKLRGIHKIFKLERQTLHSKNLKPHILTQINTICKVKLELQQSSVNLTQAILENTNSAISRLEQLALIYRRMLLDLPKNKDLLNKEISSTFSVNKTLNSALTDHFKQQFVALNSTIHDTKNNIKNQVSKIFLNKCDLFNCMEVFSNEEFIITAEMGGYIRIWDLKNKTQKSHLGRPDSFVTSLALGQSNEILLSGSYDSMVRLWDLRLNIQKHKFEGHTDIVVSVLISKNEDLGFSSSYDKKIIIWDLKKLIIKSSIMVYLKFTQICLINSENTIVAAGFEGIVFWFGNNDSQKKVSILDTQKIAFSNDEYHYITGDLLGFIRIWKSVNHKMIFEDKKHQNKITTITFSPDSNIFISCSSDKSLIIWSLKNKCSIRILTHYSIIKSAYFFKNSDNLAICSEYPSIAYLNLKTNSFENFIFPKRLYSQMVSISRDFKYMAYGLIKLVLIDLAKSKKINKTFLYVPNLCISKFSPDSKLLCCGYTSGEISIVNIPNLEQLHFFSFMNSQIRSLALSANRNLLAQGSFDGNFNVLSVKNRQIVFSENRINVTGVNFCYNDKRLVINLDTLIINIFNEFFIKVGVLKINHSVFSTIVCENDNIIVLSFLPLKWSSIDVQSCKFIFSDSSKKELIKLSKYDSRYNIFSALNYKN